MTYDDLFEYNNVLHKVLSRTVPDGVVYWDSYNTSLCVLAQLIENGSHMHRCCLNCPYNFEYAICATIKGVK